MGKRVVTTLRQLCPEAAEAYIRMARGAQPWQRFWTRYLEAYAAQVERSRARLDAHSDPDDERAALNRDSAEWLTDVVFPLLERREDVGDLPPCPRDPRIMRAIEEIQHRFWACKPEAMTSDLLSAALVAEGVSTETAANDL